MKLFKYVPIDAAIKILKTNQIGFSKSIYFNDPFDIPTNPYVPDYGIFGSLTADLKSQIWRDSTAILSLTRTATNPLMWAHYAEGHTGVVLEFEAYKSGFLSEAENVIPAQFGSVIYLSERIVGQYVSKAGSGYVLGRTYKFQSDHFEKLQRLFLYKPICWAYEEEVRIVKCIGQLPDSGGKIDSGEFSIVKANGRELHAFHLPVGAIGAAYLGMRCDRHKADEIAALLGDSQTYHCEAEKDSYALKWRAYARR